MNLGGNRIAELRFIHIEELISMLLEDYFDFLSPNDIHIKGHRIGI